MAYLRGWSSKDRSLAEGLLLYEAGMGRHGIPYRVATDPANAGFFEIDESEIDHAEAALEEWRRENVKPEPGVMPRVRLDERALRSARARRERARG